MISDLKEEDIEQVILLSDKFVGERFHTYSTIKEYISNPQKILKVYKINNEIVGFAKGKMLTKIEFKDGLLKTNISIDNELVGEGNVGFLETICVKNEYRGTEIAKKLTDERFHSLKQLGNIDLFCSTLWKTRKGTNAKKIIESMGFRKITEVQDYWYNDSIEKNYFCPECGKPPCKCSMIFYMLKFCNKYYRDT